MTSMRETSLEEPVRLPSLVQTIAGRHDGWGAHFRQKAEQVVVSHRRNRTTLVGVGVGPLLDQNFRKMSFSGGQKLFREVIGGVGG